jgi:hypothetical protein
MLLPVDSQRPTLADIDSSVAPSINNQAPVGLKDHGFGRADEPVSSLVADSPRASGATAAKHEVEK